jgi:ZIP family zinc transporter
MSHGGQRVIEAAFWGFVAGASLFAGAALALIFRFTPRVIGLIMAFGVGVLISAVAFELVGEGFELGGTRSVAAGLAAGSFTYFSGNYLINQSGGRHRKRSSGQPEDANASALVLGAVLDGIPESLAIGITVASGQGVGVALVVGVFLSNLPEALSATSGFRESGRSVAYSLTVWGSVLAVSVLAAAGGFSLMGAASESVIGFSQAFAGGAVLTMLAETMMPEAYKDAGDGVGLITVLGFGLAFMLSNMQ